ncbi:unnamed protein product [Cylindrotheca closterium]|uniref:Uncharacterized protein n=1 Tax=Cylindrotheca closterium TaxID=2856 RepID=A0AAD2FZT8_9STRA|nr:unnamed protein product [Cylindrotheca closterium]
MALPQLFIAAVLAGAVSGFVPTSFIKNGDRVLNLMDPSVIDVTAISSVVESTSQIMQQSSEQVFSIGNGISNFASQPSSLLSFTDQGQNLAGIFFQSSLLPYLAFLYFLSFKENRIPDVGNFGFQFILIFVISTIPSGIISKLTYGTSLANVDWLHGGAELLLTVANIMIVLGFKEASTKSDQARIGLPRAASLGIFALFIAAMALGPTLGFQAHSEFMLGLGDLPSSTVNSLPWVTHEDPINSLSIPTWIIHFSSVIEYLVAMNLVWNYSEVTGNEKWKGLTWGMLPLHASGICACTYHFFYNASVLQILVTMQAGFTLLGNLTCAIAAFRIAQSNGWSFGELNPFDKSDDEGIVGSNGAAAMPLAISEPKESNLVLVAKVTAMTLFLSYAVKYGELGIDLGFEPSVPAALAMVFSIPAITAFGYYKKSQGEEGSGFSFFGGDDGEKKMLSMDDVKKFGVAGTVAYVLTELAFWIIAFPVAGTALYQTTGHWPDVINEAGDRAAVLGFIFAGANVARAFVPVRLGAALALAPWVDENILRGEEKAE